MNRTSARHYFEPSWLALPLLAASACAGLCVGLFSLSREDGVCVGLLVAFMLSCWVVAYRILRQDPLLVWSPIPLFLLASGTYFGFGPLSYFFTDRLTTEYMQDVWRVTTNDLFRTIWLNTTGVVIVFGVWSWKTAFRPIVNRLPRFFNFGKLVSCT